MRVLTQGHLAQHMFFHVYHGIDLRTDAQSIFGLSSDSYYAMRKAGRTPHQAAAFGGHPDADVLDAMQAAFVTDYDDGLRIGVADETEQQILLARRRAQLGCWLNRPLPVFDSGHPYGHRYKFHGPHKQSFPRSFRDRALDSARVNRDLRGLTRSCWRPPPVWHGESARFNRAVRRLGPAPAAFASRAAGGHELVCHVPMP